MSDTRNESGCAAVFASVLVLGLAVLVSMKIRSLDDRIDFLYQRLSKIEEVKDAGR